MLEVQGQRTTFFLTHSVGMKSLETTTIVIPVLSAHLTPTRYPRNPSTQLEKEWWAVNL